MGMVFYTHIEGARLGSMDTAFWGGILLDMDVYT